MLKFKTFALCLLQYSNKMCNFAHANTHKGVRGKSLVRYRYKLRYLKYSSFTDDGAAGNIRLCRRCPRVSRGGTTERGGWRTQTHEGVCKRIKISIKTKQNIYGFILSKTVRQRGVRLVPECVLRRPPRPLPGAEVVARHVPAPPSRPARVRQGPPGSCQGGKGPIARTPRRFQNRIFRKSRVCQE